jgi:SNF2 family DNA or RNA helicase
MPEEGILAPGARVVVRDEEWLVRASIPVRTGGYAVRTIGMSELVRNQERIFLTSLDDIVEMRPEETELVADDSPQYRRSRLFLESLLRRTPPTDEKIYLGHQAAMNPSQYQMAPANMALKALRPSILIADGVGIGKTLEVGVLLSELIKRGRGERILVIALKSLLAQFQQELWSRFAIPLVRLDSLGLQRVRSRIPANKNPFYYFNRAIISIDTLKNDGRYRTYLEQCRWDVVVIDECHHVANENQRNRLATLLARTCDALVMTSATPHNGKPESFANLMNMLEPTAVADPSDYTKEEIEGLYVRRFKKDIEDEVGDYFRERAIDKEQVQASADEEKIFKRLQSLTFHTLDQKGGGGRKDILFRTTLFKAFLSSPHACLQTIENRIKNVNKKLEEKPASTNDLENDLQILEMLRDEVVDITEVGFSKLEALSAYLKRMKWSGKKKDTRIILFSERIRTLEILRDYFREQYKLKDNAISFFHAGLPDHEQMQIVEDFGKLDSPVRVMLATDVASEGVNLHYYCNHLIHFDIPWSLITLEQRNGRIDRYGQDQTPHIVYLLTAASDADVRSDLTILEKLIEKESEVHKNIGDASTLLGLHTPQKEEEYIQMSLSEGKKAEEILPEEPEEKGFLDLLMESDAVPELENFTSEMTSLYNDDMAFVQVAFEEVLEAEPELPRPDYHPEEPSLTLIAADDLRRRCQFMPREAIPEKWEFMLTTDRDQVQEAIADARKQANKEGMSAWPTYQLLWELHPVMQWLIDKVTCRFQRHEAPVIAVSGLADGQISYVFQGVLSNKQSQPVIVEWFAVHTHKGEWAVDHFEKLMEQTGFAENTPNTELDDAVSLQAKAGLGQAVKVAEQHMDSLRESRTQRLQKKVDEDKARFKSWHGQSIWKIDQYEKKRRLEGGGLSRNIAEKVQRMREEVELRRRQRQDWLENTMQVVGTPYLKLAAVFVSR